MLLDQVLLAVDQRVAVVAARMAHVRAVRLHVPRHGRVGHLQVDVPDQLIHLLRCGDAHQSLDATVEVAVHQIGGADPHLGAGDRAFADLRAVGIREGVDAAVLEEAALAPSCPEVARRRRGVGSRLSRRVASLGDRLAG